MDVLIAALLITDAIEDTYKNTKAKVISPAPDGETYNHGKNS